jgi:hypothetical protein
LFLDGLSTMGGTTDGRVHRVFALSGDPRAGHAHCAIAQLTGGAYFNLAGTAGRGPRSSND